MRQKFYVAKVERPSGKLLRPITLYAPDDVSAESSVRAMLIDSTKDGKCDVSKGDRVYVSALDGIHEDGFCRSPRDGLGAHYHDECDPWQRSGPISTIKPFG
jgi:hypothetical protein